MIKPFKITIIFILVSFFSFVSFSEDSQSQKELFRITTKDNTISATWIGVDQTINSALEGMPLTFGVHKIEFGAECCGGAYKVVHEIGGKTKHGKWISHRSILE